jgi:alcohol dehydrogenase
LHPHQANGDDLAEISKLISAGKVKPIIDSTYIFDEAGVKAAFERSMSGKASGKVVIKMQQ